MNHTANGQTVLVLGLGDSGLAMAHWVLQTGAAEVRVWDSRPQAPHEAAFEGVLRGARRVRGPLEDAALKGVTWILKSPGLFPQDPELTAMWQHARAHGVPVDGELTVFAQALSRLQAEHGYRPRVLAITGTNGKTTTTALTGHLLQEAGWRVQVAGNIGPTLLNTLWGVMQTPQDTWPQAWVLELSSFQLAGVRGFNPDVATVLNLSQDHLDWHGDMAAYAAAKAQIFGPTTRRILNREDATVAAMQPPPAPAPKSRGAAPEPDETVVYFDTHEPQAPGDWGLWEEAGMTWLARRAPREPSLKGLKADVDTPTALLRLMPADALRIRGRHNAANALAALALCVSVGCPLAPLLRGLRDYKGEPHRVQFVARIGDVDAIDDSKGTNVGATVAALLGLGRDRSPARLVMILGGDGKGQDFTPLREPLRAHARAVATIGRDAAAIEAVLQDSGLCVQRFSDLPSATRWAFEQAKSHDAVVLSPACASMDMFRHYVHRAEVFVQAVQDWAQDQGEVST